MNEGAWNVVQMLSFKNIYLMIFFLFRSFLFPVSRTEHVLEVTRGGNTDFTGQWLFQVDKLEVQHPGKSYEMKE